VYAANSNIVFHIPWKRTLPRSKALTAAFLAGVARSMNSARLPRLAVVTIGGAGRNVTLALQLATKCTCCEAISAIDSAK
jgi:hypothetical protein